MPLINGLKMACEPCIRGHRSTKCTHANERLMVPVKKPGRPLSTCPHLHGQLCGCSSVTAAIPRKQKCHCGTSTSSGALPAVQPHAVAPTISDIPSPTRAAFRVQKVSSSSKPGSRKTSFDLSNLERMNVGNVNVIPFQPMAAQAMRPPIRSNSDISSVVYAQYENGFTSATHAIGPLSPLLQSQYPSIPFQLSQLHNGFTTSNGGDIINNGTYSQLESLQEGFAASVMPSAGGSCCAPKPLENRTLNGKIMPNAKPELENSCCSSKDTAAITAHGPLSSDATPGTTTTNKISEPHQYPFPGDFQNDATIFSQYIPQTTVFVYPPSYGSYQHPLQPSEWRQSVMSNMYAQPTAQPTAQPHISNELPNFQSSPENLAVLDTLHTCSCGDGCQCIGCAAHPYNDATQNYVRSAYKIAHESSSTTTNFNNGHANGISLSPTADSQATQPNGNETSHSNSEEFASPHSETSTGEEQTLLASDYFFVNYPFTGDGCGGDTNSCPCGDACECIGCTIHRLDGPGLAFPSDPSPNGYAHANGNEPGLTNGTDIANGAAIKNEESDEDGPVKSCCG